MLHLRVRDAAEELHQSNLPRRADYRAQVNWLDAKGGFIDTSIVALACEPSYETHAEVVQAPAGAATAVVYASGHVPDKTVEITSVSFRK